jgi:hypothetical protein
MFDSVINSIYKKISAIKDPVRKEVAFNHLTRKLTENKVYKHQYQNLTLIESIQDKKKAAKLIAERNTNFIKESDMCCCKVKKANEKLLEFFNINPKTVKNTKIDNIIEVKASKPIKDILIKESFQKIQENKDKKSFQKQLNIIRFLSEGLGQENKTFIKNSGYTLSKLKESEFKKANYKAYQLRMLVEKLIKEYQKNEKEYPNQTSPKQEVALKDLKYIKKIKVQAPYNYKSPEKLLVKFIVVFYPSGVYNQEIVNEKNEIKKKMDRIERTFVNRTIYDKRRTNVINPVGTIWDGTMDTTHTTAKPGNPAFYKTELWLNTNLSTGVTWEQCYKEVYNMLKDFEVILKDMFDVDLEQEFQAKQLQKRKSEIGQRKKYETRAEYEPSYNHDLKDRDDMLTNRKGYGKPDPINLIPDEYDDDVIDNKIQSRLKK